MDYFKNIREKQGFWTKLSLWAENDGFKGP